MKNNLARFRYACRPLVELFGPEPASTFGPKSLKLVRQAMIDGGRVCRQQINDRVQTIRRVFEWAVAEELVPPSIAHGLSAVAHLRRGHVGTHEGRVVRPVAKDVVWSTLPFLSPTIRGIVELLWWTGARPGELLGLCPRDIDRTDPECWSARLKNHKTARNGRLRELLFGREAQAVLSRFLNRVPLPPDDLPMFSPKRAMEELGPTVLPTALRNGVADETGAQVSYFADTYLNSYAGNIQTPNGTFLQSQETWASFGEPSDVHLYVRGLAQHHGIGTRLLDVSHNPLVAAYFAVDYRFGNADESDTVRVIAVSPAGSCQLVDVPTHGNERLHRQYGAFLRCDSWDRGERISLLEMPGVECTCVTMPTHVGNVDRLRLLLQRLGFCPSTMYGDLDAVAAEARWRARAEHWMLAEPDCDPHDADSTS